MSYSIRLIYLLAIALLMVCACALGQVSYALAEPGSFCDQYDVVCPQDEAPDTSGGQEGKDAAKDAVEDSMTTSQVLNESRNEDTEDTAVVAPDTKGGEIVNDLARATGTEAVTEDRIAAPVEVPPDLVAESDLKAGAGAAEATSIEELPDTGGARFPMLGAFCALTLGGLLLGRLLR